MYLIACGNGDAKRNCEYEGETLSIGESFFASDGCNSCICEQTDEGTAISCTEMSCNSTESPCFTLSIDDCERISMCTVIQASPLIIDEDNQCYLVENTINPVGCIEADLSCTEVITFASSSDNPTNCYRFNTGCIPDQWSACDLEQSVECE